MSLNLNFSMEIYLQEHVEAALKKEASENNTTLHEYVSTLLRDDISSAIESLDMKIKTLLEARYPEDASTLPDHYPPQGRSASE
jgi:hypothetical protein